ncbi:MAG: ATP synthase F1 subunit delta [Candidatus Omnitrophica bacterium]|nr:ATP synthase F1 subunit delta [Candidatus Omnitrophota bacterium]
MFNKLIAQRYTDAYLHASQKTIGLNNAVEELMQLKEAIIRDNPQLMEMLSSMEITYSEKYDLIEKVLSADFSTDLRNFLKLLVQKNRVTKLPDILDFVRTNYSHGNEAEALIKTSFLLETETIKAIQQKLEKKYQKKFKFYIELDGNLLGGIKIIIGNTVIDGSVRRRLADLKQQLTAVRI